MMKFNLCKQKISQNKILVMLGEYSELANLVQNLLFVISGDREYEPKLFAMIDISYIFIIITSII